MAIPTGKNSFSQARVSAFRLGRHHLDRRAPLKSLAPVVRDMCGVQAQVMSAAQLAVWARVENLTRTDVEKALWRNRTLVKTWSMRGTVHLLATADLPVYAGAYRLRGASSVERWLAESGIMPKQLTAMTEAIIESLSEGPLTRRELTDRVAGRLGAKAKHWVGHNWGGVVKHPCYEGRVCFGPDRGREISFVLTDQWLGSKPGWPVKKAENELLGRYLTSYGPATLTDFMYWAGIRAKEAGAIRERLGEEVTEVSVEGRPALILRSDLAKLRNATPVESVRLLPSFDAFLLGHRSKSHLVDDEYYKLVFRTAGWLSPVALVNGRIAGVWSYKKTGKKVSVTIRPFGPLSGSVRTRMESEALDLGRFWGTACEVRFD